MKDNPEARELAEKIALALFPLWNQITRDQSTPAILEVLVPFIESKNAALAEANKRIKELEEKVDELVGELQ